MAYIGATNYHLIITTLSPQLRVSLLNHKMNRTILQKIAKNDIIYLLFKIYLKGDGVL